MLHIHNGDSSANTAKQSWLSGEHFAFRESLITGPTPAGVSVDEWRTLRAQHLSESYGGDLHECEKGLLDQEKKLSAAREHDEVVLWFEHDLFCQTNLLYLLNRFAHQDNGNTRFSLICIGAFPGKENFRGLGELNAEQMASLFPDRQEVTLAQLKLGEAAWQAYCSPDPTEIEKLLTPDASLHFFTGTAGDSPARAPSGATDLSNNAAFPYGGLALRARGGRGARGPSEEVLPFLRPALEAHLRRFPSTANGLGRIEDKALELIHGGAKTFLELFPGFGDAEPTYGLGDAQLWLALERMGSGKQPLLTLENGKNEGRELTEIGRKAKFEITEVGMSVLRGEADFVKMNGIDQWLGGVYLSQDNLWRWDESSATIVHG